MRITQVYTKNKELYNDQQFVVELSDEGGGEFIIIRELSTGHDIRINPEEWEEIDTAAKFLIKDSKVSGGKK